MRTERAGAYTLGLLIEGVVVACIAAVVWFAFIR